MVNDQHGNEVRPITVIVPYTDEQGYQELKRAGFLTSEHHAMYIEGKQQEIVFVGVMPSRDPAEYINVTRYLSLGKIGEADAIQVVDALTTRLKQMSAYDFLADVVMGVQEDVEFRNLIIPGILER